VVGAVMGTLLMIPLRRALIVKEHGQLTYPEGTACAEVLVAGEKGGLQARRLFQAFGLAFGYKFLMSGLKVWKEYPGWVSKGYQGASISAEAAMMRSSARRLIWSPGISVFPLIVFHQPQSLEHLDGGLQDALARAGGGAPALCNAWRALAGSSTSTWPTPLPPTTKPQMPSMLTPALPSASAAAATVPTFSSSSIVRSLR